MVFFKSAMELEKQFDFNKEENNMTNITEHEWFIEERLNGDLIVTNKERTKVVCTLGKVKEKER